MAILKVRATIEIETEGGRSTFEVRTGSVKGKLGPVLGEAVDRHWAELLANFGPPPAPVAVAPVVTSTAPANVRLEPEKPAPSKVKGR
jgi:hypothetical protein